ncbi:zinc finger protein 106 [Parambassis ranga]|uniref:Zinc finger protein 106 n=1 Tax=Parambassis ranga TaxID=210632 RepID=A0A6P7HIH9_9TELE|nr:zinc finger protein 106-like [Parambassis ranga]
MAKERTCILCETVYASKQEMEEHMRSMLHHRELEKLKGRDCGHECRVCKVKVVSLTDYASHISSPTHKQNVEAAEQKHARSDHDEEYFDQALVGLIEKRKEQIRKEKEAAAAKLAKEEEERKRKDEFQQRLKVAKERYRLDRNWQQPSHGFSGCGHQNSWYRNNHCNGREGETRPWHHNKQGKSATWHAQEPPNLQKWASGEFTRRGFYSQEGRSNNTWGQSAYYCNQQSRLPWLSNGGSSNGLYGQNNICQYTKKTRPLSLKAPPTCLFAEAFNQFQNSGNDQGGQQNGEGQSVGPDHNSSKSSKTFGSNPKLDKACRWSPYPVTKGFESAPHNDPSPKCQGQDTAPESSASNKLSQPGQKPRQLVPSRQHVEEKGSHKTNCTTDRRDGSSSSSSSRSSSSQRDGRQNDTPGSSSQKANKSLPSVPVLSSGSQLSKASTQAPSKQSAHKAPPAGPLQSRQEQQLPESLIKAKQIVLERKAALNSSSNTKMVQHIVDEQQRDQAQSQAGVNKENQQNAAKPALPGAVWPSSDSSHFLQSLQVSTSSVERSEPAASAREEDDDRKKAETQAAEAGQGSEGDPSRSGEMQTVSGTNAPSLSKLDLPPVLKRDLSKHISSKSRTGSHEPNLNIARRVRNVSETRRSDSEKDSGLKPTVRQLISSCGSRSKVNWEQVYQEVKKKQDKGKGMPRFGIEMVPCEQEYQSQEEEDIPELEGFQWESLMDTSSQGSSRKRSLSESSLAPAASQSLFTSLMALSSEQQTPTVSANTTSAQRNPDNQCQPEVGQMLGQPDAQKQPDKPALAKALQRSDSVLGDSSSGTELPCDGQGTGKRRRAAGDVPSTESPCLEHNSKRRKVKSKKERLQIDQLLAVSLREEELSRSLQTVDANLIQARAALEAAYMEVQRLMVAKQQVTVEMNTLRNKRIDLLKGMQGTREEAPLIKLKEEKMDSVDSEPHGPSSESFSSAAAPSPVHAAECASPPSSSLPLMPVAIKQEPQSPVHVSSEYECMESITHCPHSTTVEMPAAPVTDSPPDSPPIFKPPPERKLEQYQTNIVEPADGKEKLPGSMDVTEKAIQSMRTSLTPLSDSKASLKLLLSHRRGSEVGSVVDCAESHTSQPQSPSVPSLLNMPASPSELKAGKRVRKLKKRKVLNQAQGKEQLQTSDTEQDEEASRPRWLRPRRRSSGGSQVSTSSFPAEDREGDENTEGGRKGMLPIVRLEKLGRKIPKHKGESEESMEVSAACEQPRTDAAGQVPSSAQGFVKAESQSLACNEVSSTSDMDLCKSSESDMPFPITLPKNSSDASSDHGEDDMPTEGAFDGHQEAVNAMQIHNGLLYTCSGDRTIKVFDLVSHKCVGVFEGHSSKVSCLLVSAAPSLNHRLYSGSSDQTIRCYSLKTRELEQQFSLSDRVLCLHSRWKTLYAGLGNGTVVTFNLKTNKQMDAFECHGPRAVSCLASSQEGARRILLVGSYDNTISVRDAKNGLLLRTLEGHTKTVLCMKVVNDLVFSGSSDQCVYAHNIHTGELMRVYKGHSHAVTVVAVLGKVMVTACLDKRVRVYDLQSHEQLQVYSGHKDMVMCMAVHKNMIYTGCYDGSVQAVKLNLMQNYRCWWNGCSLVFGLMEHLQQHLFNDHTSTGSQMLKCRWKNCDFFCPRNSSKQGVLLHMQKHAEEETEVEP